MKKLHLRRLGLINGDIKTHFKTYFLNELPKEIFFFGAPRGIWHQKIESGPQHKGTLSLNVQLILERLFRIYLSQY